MPSLSSVKRLVLNDVFAMGSVFDLPEDHWLHLAHDKSLFNRREIESSQRCGCFYCQRIFQPEKITAWTDTSNATPGQTALCPYCGIDSVIGDHSGFETTGEFLAEMNRNWFSTA